MEKSVCLSGQGIRRPSAGGDDAGSEELVVWRAAGGSINLDAEYVAVGLEYAYYTRLRGANGIHRNTHVFHAV